MNQLSFAHKSKISEKSVDCKSKITHINFAKGFRGGERQTQLLIEQLSLLGYKQTLVVRKNSKLTPRCKDIKNLEIIEIAKPYILHCNKIKDASLLHAHETKALQFAYFCNKIFKIPYVVTRRVDNKIKDNWLNKKMYASAKVAVALSRAIQKEILRVSPSANTQIVPSAFTNTTVDALASQKIKERFKDKFLVGHVGALDDGHKGQSFFIDAARKLEKSHPTIHFILVGGGHDEEMLKNHAQGLSNITFEDFVDNVNDYINCFDLFVFPSRNEGLGSILFDVMRLEVPIIASDVGGIPDIISSGENGILIPPCDSDAIEKNIIDLFGNQEKREALASSAIKTIDKFSPQNMMLAYSKIYDAVDPTK